MVKLSALTLFFFLYLQAQGQVNPDDDLIPSQGGANDNPSRHKLYTPTWQNRIVHQGGDQRNVKAIRKKQKELEEKRKVALSEFQKLGHIDSATSCESCFTLGIQKCTVCHGNRLQECEICHGTPPDKCKRCGGEGKIFDQKCRLCEGTGVGVCSSCLNVKKSCAKCFGVGYFNCVKCKGVGKLVLGDSISRNKQGSFRSPTIHKLNTNYN